MKGNKRRIGSSDKWKFEVNDGFDEHGKRVRYYKSVYCKTERQADAELKLFIRECEKGKAAHPSSRTVNQLADEYFREHVMRFSMPTTIKSTTSALEYHIKPALGGKKLTQLTAGDIQLWLNILQDRGLSVKTIKNLVGVLSGMLHFGQRMGWVEKNVCENVMIPREKKTTHSSIEFYSLDEIRDIVDSSAELDSRHLSLKLCILLAVHTGMRKSEICGLQWGDIELPPITQALTTAIADNTDNLPTVTKTDFTVDSESGDCGYITMNRSRKVVKGGVIIDELKTKAAYRHISIPAQLTEYLTGIKMMRTVSAVKEYDFSDTDELNAFIDDQYVLLDATEKKPVYPDLLQRQFHRFCDKHGIRYLNIHALRHSHASMLIQDGISDIEIAYRMGHSSSTTTRRIYGHLIERHDEEIAQKIENTVQQTGEIDWLNLINK